jgi:hypothetical protein
MLEESLKDLNKLISLYGEDGQMYLERANLYLEMNQMDAACQDWKHASELGISEAGRISEKFCNQIEIIE